MMIKLFKPLVLVLIAVCLMQAGCADNKEKEITIIYSGNLNGELEPCGCAEATNLGGIKRRATMIQQLRAQHPDLFLISGGGLLSSDSPQDRLKGEYILKGLATMDYDAVGLQWSGDLAFGLGFIQEFALPWVASNWLSDEIPPLRTLERAGIRLAFFAWLDPHMSPQQMTGAQKIVSDDPQALIRAMAKAKGERAITVLMTTLSLEQAQERIPLEHVDLLLIQAINEKYGNPQHIGNTLVLQPGTRGMRLGRVDIVVNRDNKIDNFHSEVIPLLSSVPDAPELEAWYLEYLARGKEGFLQRAKIRKALNSGTSPYVGGDGCKDCHAQAYKVWAQSKHAGAYEDLKSVNKAYDSDCIGCHTVGFEQPGGFADPIITYHLLNVQCESCHGPSRDHANSKGAKPVGYAGWPRQKICQQCHVGSHSPSFKFEQYWPKIAHKRKVEK